MIKNTPPMGWNSWNTFGENINEEIVLATADKLIELGLDKAGYNYVVIDDCWALKQRDENGKLVCDPKKFPHGMRYLADKIHEKGLLFGMYSCSGFLTCAQYPSSLDYEWIDAKTFAEWHVDFLKYDYCFKPSFIPGELLYRTMGLALANCGRDILFSACSWGADETHKWIRSTNSTIWRSTFDINDSFESIKSLLKAQIPILPYGGKGCFNDIDMLVVGMHGQGNVGLTGCTDDEYALHFAAWSLLQSPLMIGCDLRKIDETSLNLLKNQMLIDINRDELCAQPFVFKTYEPQDEEAPAIARYLANGDIALGFFNLTDEDRCWFFAPRELGLNLLSNKALELTDCLSGEKIYCDVMSVISAKKHACRVFRAKVVDKK